LLEALTAFEEAAKLDPEAAGVFKAQVPLLLMLDRRGRLECGQTRARPRRWRSRLLVPRRPAAQGARRAEGVSGRARQGARHAGLVKSSRKLAQQLYFDLGQYLESTDAFADAIVAYTESAKILDSPRT